ncbi:ComF family protein [Flavobacteriaceae bacterium F08102]|nr:ComF family protein [Flavobacteriaceae bacterium F08102]
MRFFKDIFRLFFPNICVNCANVLIDNERSLCLHCLSDLPYTHFIAYPDNPVEKTFYGRIPLEFGASLLYYHQKGSSQKLIYALKYKGIQEIGALLAEQVLIALNSTNRFPPIDVIIPVPLHPTKLKSRGYNQLTTFGLRLAKGLNCRYDPTVIKRTSITETQTKKKRIERFKNVKERFVGETERLENSEHVLLIDDVITTGATLEACALCLLKSQVKISVITMAFTE